MKTCRDLTDIADKKPRDMYLPFAAFKRSLSDRQRAFKGKFRDRQAIIKKTLNLLNFKAAPHTDVTANQSQTASDLSLASYDSLDTLCLTLQCCQSKSKKI